MKKINILYFCIFLNLNIFLSFSKINFKNKLTNNKIIKYISNNPKKTTFALFLCNSFLSYKYFNNNNLLKIISKHAVGFLLLKFLKFTIKGYKIILNKILLIKISKSDNLFFDESISLIDNSYKYLNYGLFLFFISNNSYKLMKNIKNKILNSLIFNKTKNLFLLKFYLKKVELETINKRIKLEADAEIINNLKDDFSSGSALFNEKIKIKNPDQYINYYLNKNNLLNNLKNLYEKNCKINADFKDFNFNENENNNEIIFKNKENKNINDFLIIVKNNKFKFFNKKLYLNIFQNCIFGSNISFNDSNLLKVNQIRKKLNFCIPWISYKNETEN